MVSSTLFPHVNQSFCSYTDRLPLHLGDKMELSLKSLISEICWDVTISIIYITLVITNS